MLRRLFSRETLIAMLLSLAILLVWLVTADSSPQWIYQGF